MDRAPMNKKVSAHILYTITNGINYHLEQLKLILLSTEDFSRQNRVPRGFAGTIKSSSNRREIIFRSIVGEFS